MFYSGRWQGFWEQQGIGREYMHDLMLRFSAGKIEGEGHDIIGRFTFRGTYDDRGAVTLVKQYIGQHQVLYRGRYDGEGTIHGEWNIHEFWRGPFALRLEGQAVVADTSIAEIKAGVDGG